MKKFQGVDKIVPIMKSVNDAYLQLFTVSLSRGLDK